MQVHVLRICMYQHQLTPRSSLPRSFRKVTSLGLLASHFVRCLLGRPSDPSSSLTTTSTFTKASGGIGGTTRSFLTNVPDDTAGDMPCLSAAAARAAAACPPGDRATHSAASSAVAKYLSSPSAPSCCHASHTPYGRGGPPYCTYALRAPEPWRRCDGPEPGSDLYRG